MKLRHFITCLAGLALALVLVTGASAEGPAQHKGLYVFGGLGANWVDDSDISGGASGEVDFDTGFVGAVAVGYGFGNGLRFEGELGYRQNETDDFSGVDLSGRGEASSLMFNLLYDFDVSPRFVPYVGLGAGLAVVQAERVSPLPAADVTDDDDTVFAWQAILGVAIPLNDSLDLTVDYRYFDANDADLRSDAGVSFDAEYTSHSALIGLRYRFGAPKPAPRPRPAVAPPIRPAPAPAPPPPPVAKPAPPPPPPPAPRSFIVFFDWDRSDIRPDAQRVLEAAAAHYKNRGLVRVNLTGHADRSGPARYNMGLSLRRAQAVKAAMVKLGVSANNISLVGRGESEPLVATADGVREPRNRRVEITF